MAEPAREEESGAMAAVLAAVESDARSVAESVCALMADLRSCLAEASQNTIEHMECHLEAAGRLQEATLEAAAKGNRFVNDCLRLNEEMRGIAEVAQQIKALRQRLDQLEAQAYRHLPQLT